MPEIIIELEEDKKDASIITSWQSVPLPVVAAIWTNTEFRKEFLEDPDPILKGILNDCPYNMSFCVLENTEDARHLIIPHRDIRTYGWEQQKFADCLKDEVGYDLKNIDYGLPNDLIIKCAFDFSFKVALMRNPKHVLQEQGYSIDPHKEYYIHENTDLTSHILLPYNKWRGQGLSAEQLQYHVVNELAPPELH